MRLRGKRILFLCGGSKGVFPLARLCSNQLSGSEIVLQRVVSPPPKTCFQDSGYPKKILFIELAEIKANCHLIKVPNLQIRHLSQVQGINLIKRQKKVTNQKAGAQPPPPQRLTSILNLSPKSFKFRYNANLRRLLCFFITKPFNWFSPYSLAVSGELLFCLFLPYKIPRDSVMQALALCI